MAANDRVEMSLDQVIKTDWTGPKGGSRGDSKASTPSAPRGKVAAFGKAVLGRGKGGKAAGRGLVRRNPIMTKVRRTPVKGASKSKGKGNVRWVPKGEAIRNEREMSRGKGKGRSEGKSGGKGKSSGKSGKSGFKSGGKSSGKSSGKSTQRFGMRLWRGATTRPTNAETRGPKGKSKGKGKSLGKSSNLLRVNRNQTFVKRSTKGLSKGKKGGGKSLAVSTYSSKGQGSYSKGKFKGKSYDSGYGSGRNGSSYGGSYGGSSYGGGYGGGGGWGQGYDNYYKGKGSRESSPRASDQLTAEDKRMMKKITVVAQLDKVPKPHPAMQGLRKRSTGGDTGALSSRFAANFRR